MSTLPSNRAQMAVLVVPRLEKGIAERDSLDVLHVDIIDKVGINVKKHGHVDRLTRIQPLLLKTEALNLAKIRRDLAGGDRVGGDADNVLVRLVRRRVKGQRRLAGQHTHLALLRHKLPRKHIRHGSVEGDADARVRLNGLQALGRVAVVVAAVCGRLDGLTAPACLLADLDIAWSACVSVYREERGYAVPFCTWAPSHT
jgi:hypothetical protein